MGLNPPFGVKAALANKFIDKALEFNPKLLILIVPPETERYYVPSLSLSLSLSLKHSQLFPLTRLDKKNFLKSRYELVWEDNQFLSGKVTNIFCAVSL